MLIHYSNALQKIALSLKLQQTGRESRKPYNRKKRRKEEEERRKKKKQESNKRGKSHSKKKEKDTNNNVSVIPFIEIIHNIANREGRYAIKREQRKENKSSCVVLEQQRNRLGV